VRFAPLVLAIAPFLAVAAAAALASGEDSLRATALGVLLTSLAVAGSAHRIATGGTSAGVASEGAPPKERRLEARE